MSKIKVKVGKLTYYTEILPSRRANWIVFTIGKHVSKTLGKILSDVFAMDTANEQAAYATAALTNVGAIKSLMSEILEADPDIVFDIYVALADTTTFEGEKIDLDNMPYDEVLLLVKELTKVQIAPFSKRFSKTEENEKGKRKDEQEESIPSDSKSSQLETPKNDLTGLEQQSNA